MALSKQLARKLSHLIFRTPYINRKAIRAFSKNIKNKKILEIGSGAREQGVYPYSVKKYFHSSNEFICSDIVKEYGHQIIDVTKMSFKNKFDIVICMNVLEHVYEFQKAIENLYRALKKGGKLFVIVPCFYPLHNEPHDYWRFTEHALRRMFQKFSYLKVKPQGAVRQFPSAYVVHARK